MDVNILEEKCRQKGKVLFMSDKGRYSCRMREEDKKAKRSAASQARRAAIDWVERCRALGKVHHVSPTGRNVCRKSPGEKKARKSPGEKRAPTKHQRFIKGWMSHHPKMPGQTQQDRMRAANADWQRAKESDQDIDEYMANE